MTGTELIDLLEKAHRRPHITGNIENGVIVALNMEGRLFAVVNNTVINRVVPSAIMNRSNKNAYQNPGGDTLWPAPEGTIFGYEYNTGKWRVPPSVTGAVWEVISQTEDITVIRAETDLVNNMQLGIPCEFERIIHIKNIDNGLIVNVNEIIRYIGTKKLKKGEFLIAPWSLCQFDSGSSGKVTIPPPGKDDIWDLYEPGNNNSKMTNSIYVIDTKTEKRFQLGLSENIPWIEYTLEGQYRVKRYTGILPAGQSYIDISDAPPDKMPSPKGIKLSVYCDPSGFMEIEACGGCPEYLVPGTELNALVTTEYRIC
jgi:hypothetical protein